MLTETLPSLALEPSIFWHKTMEGVFTITPWAGNLTIVGPEGEKTNYKVFILSPERLLEFHEFSKKIEELRISGFSIEALKTMNLTLAEQLSKVTDVPFDVLKKANGQTLSDILTYVQELWWPSEKKELTEDEKKSSSVTSEPHTVS